MSTRILKYLFTHEGLWIRFGLGIALIATKFMPWLGWIAILAGIHRAWRLVHDTPELEERLEILERKRRFSLQRELSELEQRKLIEILQYTKAFEARGGDPLVAESLNEHAWRIVYQGKAGAELSALHASLPPLGRGHRADRQSVLDMVDREAAIIRASELEVQRVVRAVG